MKTTDANQRAIRYFGYPISAALYQQVFRSNDRESLAVVAVRVNVRDRHTLTLVDNDAISSALLYVERPSDSHVTAS